jgi:spore coat protein A
MNTVGRRTFLGGGLAAVIGAGVGVPLTLGAGGSTSTGNLLPSRRPLPPAFAQPLQLPAVLQPTRSDATADYYDITQRRALASILPDVKTEIWGYNGIFPGPTLVSRHGRSAVVTHRNDLPLPTVVHLHGGRTPPDSDGYPLDFINPADMSYMNGRMEADVHGSMKMPESGGNVAQGFRTYAYPLEQRAAGLWYHDHRMDFTGPSVWRGLAGFHLHRDEEEDALGLPSGSRELPLMILDRSFNSDGSFLYPSVDVTLVNTPGVTDRFVPGVLGDTMLVNGTPWPQAQVEGAQYRLRLLNACNARRLSLRLDPPPRGGIVQIGTDGGLLSAPSTHGHLEMAPAQRFDVIVDFAGYRPGTVVTMVNDFGEAQMAQVMQFVVGEPTDDQFRIPDHLSTIHPLEASQAVVTRTFQFQTGDVSGTRGWLIDGAPFSPTNISASVKLGTVEVWRLMADFHHPIHIHLNPFQVLSRGLGGPGEFDKGWKDTIDLRPAEEASIAIQFDGYAGKYVFHCHNLEHEDMAMMANFETLR